MTDNLYVHFPFCRRKCSYCALHSRAGVSSADRDAYVRRLVRELSAPDLSLATPLKTVYFGGGSPALCDLRPLLRALAPRLSGAEFTVELHPLDVTADLLKALRDGGVNRISMGVQSLDDDVLADMGRGHSLAEAERAFAQVKGLFDNAGIDLIVGYPHPKPSGRDTSPVRLERLAAWGLRHCSVYSLILEEKTILHRRLRDNAATGIHLPSDDETLDRLAVVSRFLRSIGLARYEISNYAAAGHECRHNLAVWRGEDYCGLGDGAFGRVGLTRTSFAEGRRTLDVVDAETDLKERALFRLRTREGLETARFPQWTPILGKYVEEGLLTQTGTVFRLTERGTEVCDSILAELV